MTNVIRAAVFCLLSLPLAAATEWTRVSSPNFDLYTTAGESAGRAAALHFEQIRSFFAQASPVKPPGDFPLRIVAFANGEQYRPYTPNTRAAAYFAGGPGNDYIVMRDANPEYYPVAVHEYMHFVIRHSGLRLPIWLSEGWADVYSSMRPVKDGMAVGDLIPGRMRALEAAKGTWFDFATLTSVTANSPIYNEGERTSLFYAESWALAHMLFLSPDYRENFGKFLMALHRGATAADACQTAFGKTSQQVFADVRTYFDRRKLVGTVFQTSLGKAESEPRVATVDEFDAKLLLADLQVATGRLDIARIEYERLEKLKPERIDLQKSIGYLFWSLRDNRQAKDHLARAFAAGGNDPQMCYTLALLQMASNEPVNVVLASLERAIAVAPTFTDALLQLGIVRSVARQFEGAIQALMAIPAVTPDRAPGLFNALAYAYLQTGDTVQARTHLATARRYAGTPQASQALEQLSILIEARAKSAFAPRPGEKLQHLEGMVRGIDCSEQMQRMQFTPTTGAAILIDLPATAAVELIRPGGGALQLQCGTMSPFRAVVEIGLSPATRTGSAGVLRTLQY